MFIISIILCLLFLSLFSDDHHEDPRDRALTFRGNFVLLVSLLVLLFTIYYYYYYSYHQYLRFIIS